MTQGTPDLILSLSTANLSCSEIGLGICSRYTSLNAFPGFTPSSWAYYGDDGKLFAESLRGIGTLYGETFGTGDVVGCKIAFGDRVTFTKNGTSLGEDRENLLPTYMKAYLALRRDCI